MEWELNEKYEVLIKEWLLLDEKDEQILWECILYLSEKYLYYSSINDLAEMEEIGMYLEVLQDVYRK